MFGVRVLALLVSFVWKETEDFSLLRRWKWERARGASGKYKRLKRQLQINSVIVSHFCANLLLCVWHRSEHRASVHSYGFRRFVSSLSSQQSINKGYNKRLSLHPKGSRKKPDLGAREVVACCHCYVNCTQASIPATSSELSDKKWTKRRSFWACERLRRRNTPRARSSSFTVRKRPKRSSSVAEFSPKR